MLIKVKVFPESRKEEIKKIKEGKFEVYVRARAKNNEANQRVIEILKNYFEGNFGVRLIGGHHRLNKTFEVLDGSRNLI